MNDSQITIAGNLTDDPELKYTQNGQAVCTFAVAVSEREKKGDKWEETGASFYGVTAWRSLAENCAETLRKGQRVIVLGTIRQESWETDEGKRSTFKVTARDVGASCLFAAKS